MRSVTSVAFDREERDVFNRAHLWRDLTDHERRAVLTRLSYREPNGVSHAALTDAHEVLSSIIAKAQADLDEWLPRSQELPEEADENAIVTNPRQAALTIVEARQQTLKDCTEALFLIETALRFATPPEPNEKYVGL
jgi:hypothetical protein